MTGPPTLADDCFAGGGADWTPVSEALSRLKAAIAPVVTPESCPLSVAGGRILAADVLARVASPPTNNAAVDGFGFNGDVLTGAAAVLRLPLQAARAAAGHPAPEALRPGHAIRILTGAVLPEGVDTIVMSEDAAIENGEVCFARGLRRGANCRDAGEDVQTGAVSLSAGQRVTPQAIALAAATGHEVLPVYRPLRIAVLSTGDELVDPGETLPAGGVFDANRPMLLDILRRWSGVAVDLGRVGDNRGRVMAAFDRGAENADVIVATGGASAGDEDHVSAALRARDALHTWRIAMKPGRPLALGMWSGTPVFGLPGNPVAAFVCALIFLRPALHAMGGGGWTTPRGEIRKAAFSKKRKPGRREYLRARLDAAGHVEAFRTEGSGIISGLSWADGLCELPDDGPDIAPGDPVSYLPYDAFGI